MPTTTTTRSLLRALPFLLVAAVGPASAAPPAPLGPGGAPLLAEGIAAFNAAAEFPLPRLSAADSAKLLSGEVVRLFDQPGGDPEGPRRASGLLIVNQPRDVVWVAVMDPHYVQSEQATEVRVAFEPPDRSRWYGIIDLPRPFADRHWIVDVRNNHALAKSTGNRAWEHPWRLRAEGPAELPALFGEGKLRGIPGEALQEAIYTPVNHGAWLVVALDKDHTLLGYHATSVVGGAIPESLIARFVHASLGDMLTGAAARAAGPVRGHYTASHKQVIGGDGSAVRHFGDASP
jgi:hypothetical protein